MFSTEDLKTAIGATVIARRNAAARLREAGNPRNPFRALPGMEQQFFEAAQSVRSYDLVLNLLEREVKREARKRAGRTAQSAAVFLITAGLIILATLGFAAALRTLMEEPSIYERYCVNAYDRIVSFFQLRLVMDRYNTIYRELGKLPPRAPEFDPEYDGE